METEDSNTRGGFAGWIASIFILVTFINSVFHAIDGLGILGAAGSLLASLVVFMASATATGELGRAPTKVALGVSAIASVLIALAAWGYVASGVLIRFWVIEFTQVRWIVTCVALGGVAGRAQHWGPLVQADDGERD